ncbi:MAG: DUF3365 domain-containing protein [Planctomycetaceae bacterium]|nr:DUF3365 domain-containing protein [Planctomycetaceae bacterium]
MNKPRFHLAMVAVLTAGILLLEVPPSARVFTFPQSARAEQRPATAGQQHGHRVRPLDSVRREVRMLDDIYKGGIVTITQHYVSAEDSIPAGTAFKQLFVAAEKKGWHRVRLLDATGEPYSKENRAEDSFEKRAVARLLKGETWVEEIEQRNGVRHLRVATPIPVVFEKCIMCHDNYRDVPAGQPIGALTYLLPVDGQLQSEHAPGSK